MKKDIMSVLPDGSEFVSWEMPCSYDTVIHVNPAHKMSADNNDGSSEAPLKTISEAARRAVAGTKVVIHQGYLSRMCSSSGWRRGTRKNGFI